MKKIAIFCGLCFFIFLFPILATGQAERGSVQGSIFRDTNGDGICQDGAPLAGIAITLESASSNSKFSVRSAADGSFSVGSAAQGTWAVSATSTSGRWQAVSTNPIQLEISSTAGLDKEQVNFCMQRIVVNGPVPPQTGTFVRFETAASASESGAEPTGTTKSLPEQSQELLTQPPESIQPTVKELEEVTSKTVEEEAVPVDEWLGYVNTFRAMAGVDPVSEDAALTFGAQSHARYMVVHDRPIAHAEDPAFALYSPEGHQAGKNGLIFATSQIQADHTWATNFFVSGPFHLIPLIDPNLETVGFGAYNESIGTFNMAGVLDVRSGLNRPDDSIDYPLMFPTDGAETWVLRHSLFEWPNPMPHCGFSRPAGPPIVLMLGTGIEDGVPRVGNYSVTGANGVPLDLCLIHEANFTAENEFEQREARIILDLRDAVVLIPRSPLAADSSYSVSIEVDGETHSWSFSTRKSP